MSHDHQHIQVFINQTRYSFEAERKTGRALKERAHIQLDHVLCVQAEHHHLHADDCDCSHEGARDALEVVGDEQFVFLKNGQHFWSIAGARSAVTVTIDSKEYEFADPNETGRSLKERAGVALADVLFLDRPHEDEVIADDTKVTLKCGDCFHSAPPANYGNSALSAESVGFERFIAATQPDGWTFLIVSGYPIPDGFSANEVRLLIKLPPAFPDAAPDMFWVQPQIKTVSGAAPQGTSAETLLGEEWQRFSWHLAAGAWRPGTSTLRDYMRCVRARLEKRN
jgi:E2/UBC family protein E